MTRSLRGSACIAADALTKGSYVTTSLLAEGVWSASVSIQAALCGAEVLWAARSKESRQCGFAQCVSWACRLAPGSFLLVLPDKLAAVAKAIGPGRDLLTDPRFSDPAKLIQNMAQLTAILDEVFSSQPAMSHWQDVFNGSTRHLLGVVRWARGSHRRSATASERHCRSARSAGGTLTSSDQQSDPGSRRGQSPRPACPGHWGAQRRSSPGTRFPPPTKSTIWPPRAAPSRRAKERGGSGGRMKFFPETVRGDEA